MMKKCKRCSGKGFVFDKIGVWIETGIKMPCPNCFGKGAK